MNKELEIKGFDFHCHIDLHPEPAALIDRCENNRIAVLAVTTTPKAYSQNLLWTENKKYVHCAVGLHPELVGVRFVELDLLEKNISRSRLIGEVGLDGSPKYRSNYEKQKEVFLCALKTSQKHGGRVMSIHSRRAAKDVIDMIIKHIEPTNVITILHWFTASITDAKRAIDAGCYFSVNSAMVRSEKGRSLLKLIPVDKILTETDSPFIKTSGRNSEPMDVMQTIVDLADLLGESASTIKEKIDKNSKKVFMFAGINLQK